MPSDPSRLIAALARDRINLDLKTLDLCFLAGLYLRADRASLASFEEDVLIDMFEQVCDVVDPGAERPRKRATHAIQRLRDQRMLARVDGAGFWGIYFRVMMPMSIPIFTVGVILQVTGIWNDFLFGVVYTGPETYPMTVALNNIVNSTQGVVEYNVNMAATILTGLVPLIIYFVSGRLFVRGIAAGAVKG